MDKTQRCRLARSKRDMLRLQIRHKSPQDTYALCPKLHQRRLAATKQHYWRLIIGKYVDPEIRAKWKHIPYFMIYNDTALVERIKTEFNAQLGNNQIPPKFRPPGMKLGM